MSIRYYINNIIGGISQYFRQLNEQRMASHIPEPRINIERLIDAGLTIGLGTYNGEPKTLLKLYNVYLAMVNFTKLEKQIMIDCPDNYPGCEVLHSRVNTVLIYNFNYIPYSTYGVKIENPYWKSKNGGLDLIINQSEQKPSDIIYTLYKRPGNEIENNIKKFDKNNLILTGKIKAFPSIFSGDMIELDEIANLYNPVFNH